MPQSSIITDAQLVSRIRESDDAALDELFRRHYVELCYTANRLVRDHDQAQDIIQGLFVFLWDRRATLPADLSSVEGYLHRAARNRSLNYLRDQARIPVDGSDMPLHLAAPDRADQALCQEDLRTRLHHAIDRLPERCRLVFTMSKLEDMSQREVADSLGISPKTVENQMTRAYRFLREWLSCWVYFALIWWG